MILPPHRTIAGLPFRIVSFSEIDSTSRFLKEWGRQSPEDGLVVVADFQTSGRGRWGRRWESPRGEGLWFSLLMAPVEASSAAPMPLMAGVALYDTIADAFPALQRSLELKWPNDLLLSGKKVAGILAELDYSAREVAVAEAAGKDSVSPPARPGRRGDFPPVSFVVLGIGLNCNQSRFPADLPDATSLCQHVGAPIDRRMLMEAFLGRWHRWRTAPVRPSEDVVKEWKRRSSFWSGRTVRFTEHGKLFQGITRNVTPSGALVVRLDSGEEQQILSGEVEWIRNSVDREARDEDK